jgi:2-oxoglutarate ferredoxin oxidoreductase subunit gamma
MGRGRQEVRIAGFGGQGVVLAGVVLGRAGMLDGRWAVQCQSYGAEARGGAARSEIVLDDEPILYPEVVAPDLMVLMSQVACDKYGADLAPEGRLIYETDLVSRLPDGLADHAAGAAFTAIAEEEVGRAIAANMVALGCMVGRTDVVSRSSLEQAIAETVPEGTAQLNLQACTRGLELAAA